MSLTKKKKNIFSFLIILFLLLSLPLSVYLVSQIQIWWQRAAGIPANIIVDTAKTQGPLPQPWKALAQGGEENEKMLSSVISETKFLAPKYIRIDHIYDRYDLVGGKKNGAMTYNFSRLDRLVDDVLKTGALPLISLSYMPKNISRDGQVTSPPSNWNDWAQVVQVTIEHFSGKSGKNLKDIYYEVWNEPDLFGHWKIGRDPDYLLLYRFADLGAQKARNVNQFFLGGPATTAIYPNWLAGLLKSGLRVDFLSWHRYSPNPQVFEKDIAILDETLAKNPSFYYTPRLITEWGSDSENSPLHDETFDAIHTIAAVRKFLGKITWAFSFEIKDGPSPEGKKYWGRWGILTHETVGVEKKPRYHALAFLNQMTGERLEVSGEGTWVTGFATKKDKTTQLMLVNFDRYGKHSETFPVNFINLSPGTYNYKESFLLGRKSTKTETLTSTSLQKNLFMPPNSAVFIELEAK